MAIKLKIYASLWGENLKRDRERIRKAKMRTWSKKRELQKRFIQDTYQQEVYLKYFNFKQSNLSLTEYTRAFEFKCDIKEPEPQTIARYIGGLKKSIGDMIRSQPY